MVGDSSRKWLMHYNSSSVKSIQEIDLQENDRVYFEMTNNTTEDGDKGAVYVSV
jgi:heme/copper-type cytochrome/quinol oxidase subunit 2